MKSVAKRSHCICNRSFTEMNKQQKTLCKYEPLHDKTNKMVCAPNEDSDQPGHPPILIRVFTVRMKKAWVLSYPLSAQWRLWSDWADADLSLRWRTCHFVGFVIGQLIYCLIKMITMSLVLLVLSSCLRGFVICCHVLLVKKFQTSPFALLPQYLPLTERLCLE